MEVLLILLLLVILAVAIVITSSIVHLALFLFMAGLIGWLASKIVMGDRPYGCLGATLAGLLGGWLGQLIMGPVGPPLFGVRLVPALVGAIILAFLSGLLFRRSPR